MLIVNFVGMVRGFRGLMGRAKGGGPNVSKSKTSRGWPAGNHVSRPSESCFWGGQLREMEGEANVPRWGGSETVFHGGSPCEVLIPPLFFAPPPLAFSRKGISMDGWISYALQCVEPTPQPPKQVALQLDLKFLDRITLEMHYILARQNCTSAIASNFRIDGSKLPEIPQKT